MTNKYIKIIMTPSRNNIGGSFTTFASFKLDNIDPYFSNIEVKIDTGCSISTIPLAKFNTLNKLCNNLKHQDIKNNVPWLISYGVETSGEKHFQPETLDEKMNCPALKFRHKISDLKIAGVPVEHKFIYVNYNRKGNILIGMDILSTMDIHIGTVNTGETVFLACPKDQLNDEYFRELNRLFGIGDSIITAEATN